MHVIAIYGLLELIARQEITPCYVITWLTEGKGILIK